MTPKLITIHCSDSPNGRAVTTDEIRRWHTDPAPKGRGWADIGYHRVVETDGGCGIGRQDNVMGAHVTGANQDNLAVCVVGKDRFTRAQFASLKYVLRHWMLVYNIEVDRVFGHYEFASGAAQGKTCPNMDMDDVRAWLRGDDSVMEKYILEVA
jgi:N-acetylmuramoyl-L-alanine amidase